MTTANIYCDLNQLKTYYDGRTISQLSGDQDDGSQVDAVLETLLDTAGTELDSVLAGRYSVAASAVPAILTRWVAVKAMGMAFDRRSVKHEGVAANVEWADKFADNLMARKVNLPIARTNAPAVVMGSSGEPTHSRFDNIPFGDRSVTGGEGNT